MIQIDIDMPKQCGECPLCVDYDCIIHKRVTDEYYDTLEEQYAHCPLTLPSAKEKPFKLPEIYIADGYDTVAGEDGNVGFGVYVPNENYICVAGDVEDEIRARALFHELCHWVQDMCGRPFNEDEANEFSDIVYDALQSAQQDAIPIEWIEKKIEWLKGLDNEFAALTARNISAMLNQWRGEQNETD